MHIYSNEMFWMEFESYHKMFPVYLISGLQMPFLQTSSSSSKLYFKQSIQIYKNTELIHTKHYLLLFKATREAHELIELVACFFLGFFVVVVVVYVS